jgi:hypothetical protein
MTTSSSRKLRITAVTAGKIRKLATTTPAIATAPNSHSRIPPQKDSGSPETSHSASASPVQPRANQAATQAMMKTTIEAARARRKTPRNAGSDHWAKALLRAANMVRLM